MNFQEEEKDGVFEDVNGTSKGSARTKVLSQGIEGGYDSSGIIREV